MLENATKYMTIEQHVTAVQAQYIFHCARLRDQRKLHGRRNAKTNNFK
jgi:hypothetical protein